MNRENIIDLESKRIEKNIKNMLKKTGLSNTLYYPIKISVGANELNLLWKSAKDTISIWKDTMLPFDEDQEIVELENILYTIEESIETSKENPTNIHLDVKLKDIDDIIAILEIGGGVHFYDEDNNDYFGWSKKNARILMSLYERIHGVWEMVDKIIQEK